MINHHIYFETFSQATGCFLHCVTEASVQQAPTENVVMPEHTESYWRPMKWKRKSAATMTACDSRVCTVMWMDNSTVCIASNSLSHEPCARTHPRRLSLRARQCFLSTARLDGPFLLQLLWCCMLTFMSRVQFLPSPPLSKRTYCDAWHHAVCVSAALVWVVKVIRCIQCALVICYCKTVLWHANVSVCTANDARVLVPIL